MTVNLILKGIPKFNPHIKYGHGDMFYVPEKNQVFMYDKYHRACMPVYGDPFANMNYTAECIIEEANHGT